MKIIQLKPKKLKPVLGEAKKPRLNKENKPFKTAKPAQTEKKAPFEKKSLPKKSFNKEKGGNKSKPFVKKQQTSNDKKPAAEVKLSIAEQKELKIKRKKQKLGENYETNVNMKKIWETLRRLE